MTHGARIVVSSDVPEGKGVSSSAAVETASMHAVAAVLGIELEVRELALLCQKSENLVSGAPCGVMDQVTVAMGTAGSVLPILCRPATVRPTLALPPGTTRICRRGVLQIGSTTLTVVPVAELVPCFDVTP